MATSNLAYWDHRRQVQLREALKKGQLDLLQLVVDGCQGLCRELVKIVVCRVARRTTDNAVQALLRPTMHIHRGVELRSNHVRVQGTAERHRDTPARKARKDQQDTKKGVEFGTTFRVAAPAAEPKAAGKPSCNTAIPGACRPFYSVVLLHLVPFKNVARDLSPPQPRRCPRAVLGLRICTVYRARGGGGDNQSKLPPTMPSNIPQNKRSVGHPSVRRTHCTHTKLAPCVQPALLLSKFARRPNPEKFRSTELDDKTVHDSVQRGWCA